MKILYSLRHGDYIGRPDSESPLSETGIEEMTLTANRIKPEVADLKVCVVPTSFRRIVQSGEIVKAVLDVGAASYRVINTVDTKHDKEIASVWDFVKDYDVLVFISHDTVATGNAAKLASRYGMDANSCQKIYCTPIHTGRGIKLNLEDLTYGIFPPKEQKNQTPQPLI